MIGLDGEVYMDNPEWYGIADYADGTRVEKTWPYLERGIYPKECERQAELEAELIELSEVHGDCTFYSVGVRETL